MTARVSAAEVLKALAIPASAHVDQRVPKKLLVEQGAPTASDKRQILDGIESLHWVAALKPTTVGVPSYRDHNREYLEIAVVVANLRGSVTNSARATRLMELIHRAIPYPAFLLAEGSADTKRDGTVVSLAHKRHAQNEAGKVVIEDMRRTNSLTLESNEHANFLAALPISSQPAQDLFALYQGWMDSVLALQIATITGKFALPQSLSRSGLVQESVDTYARLERELAALRSEAKKERQMNRRVELNTQIKKREADVANLLHTLEAGSTE